MPGWPGKKGPFQVKRVIVTALYARVLREVCCARPPARESLCPWAECLPRGQVVRMARPGIARAVLLVCFARAWHERCYLAECAR